MKKLIYPLAILAVICLSAFTIAQAVSWKIAEGYAVKFTSKDPSGVFTSLKGDVVFDETNLPGSKFDVTIATSSINCGNGMQNSQAKSAKWLDEKTYPAIKFTSSKITSSGARYLATGNLLLHGVTKEITIPFTFSKSALGGRFNGEFEVNRSEYNIGEPGGKAADVLKITLSVPVTQ